MASEEDLRAADEFIQKHAVEAAVFAVVDFEATRHAIATVLTAARAETWEKAIAVVNEFREASAVEAQRQEDSGNHAGFNALADQTHLLRTVLSDLEAAAGSKTKVFSREDEQKNQGR